LDEQEAIALAVFVAFAVGVWLYKEAKLENPKDKKFVHLDDFGSDHLLGNDPVEAALFRQSGNLYRHLGFFDTPELALSEVKKSFRRAKIESVSILKNTEDRLEVTRLFYNGRGRAEGKKLGGAIILRAK